MFVERKDKICRFVLHSRRKEAYTGHPPSKSLSIQGVVRGMWTFGMAAKLVEGVVEVGLEMISRPP